MSFTIALGVHLRLRHLDTVDSRTPDERVYARQGLALLNEGHAGIERLVSDYLADPVSQRYPPPSRAGFIALVAAAIRLTDVSDPRSVAWLSTVASVGSLAVLALLGLRFLPASAAVAGVVLFAASPMELAVARRGWQDAFVGLIGLILLYVGCEAARPRSSRGWLAALALVGSASLTVKESTAIAFGLVALGVLWVQVARRDRGGIGVLVTASAIGTTMSVAWLASTVGGIHLLWRIVSNVPVANASNAYALGFQTGPWYSLPVMLWVMAPAATALAAMGCTGAFWRFAGSNASSGPREPAPPGALAIAAYLAAFLAVPMVLPHWMNLRYVSPVFGAFNLIAGFGAHTLISEAVARSRGRLGPPRLLYAVGIAATLFLASHDYERFEACCVKGTASDLSLGMLVRSATP